VFLFVRFVLGWWVGLLCSSSWRAASGTVEGPRGPEPAPQIDLERDVDRSTALLKLPFYECQLFDKHFTWKRYIFSLLAKLARIIGSGGSRILIKGTPHQHFTFVSVNLLSNLVNNSKFISAIQYKSIRALNNIVNLKFE
jgi:hypothetical protein